ncbi:MAG: hypothetical protein AAGM84_08755 [Pseudomonadota bacterium]
MSPFDTVRLVNPPTLQAWARAVAVVGVFLLAEQTGWPQPLVAAFWTNILLIMAANLGRVRRSIALAGAPLWSVGLGFAGVLGLFVLVSMAGERALMITWIAYFGAQALYKLWTASYDMDYTVSFYEVGPEGRQALGLAVLFEGVALAITAACLASLAFTAPLLGFVAMASFGWLITFLLCNWTAVLILMQRG